MLALVISFPSFYILYFLSLKIEGALLYKLSQIQIINTIQSTYLQLLFMKPINIQIISHETRKKMHNQTWRQLKPSRSIKIHSAGLKTIAVK